MDWTFEEVIRIGRGPMYGFALAGGEVLVAGGNSYSNDIASAWCDTGTKLTHPDDGRDGVIRGLRRPWIREGRIYLPGEYGLLAMSDDRGATWTTADLDGSSACIYRVVEDPETRLLATCDDGILGSDDGRTWRMLHEDVRVLGACFTKSRAIFCGDEVVIRERGVYREPEDFVPDDTLCAVTQAPSGAILMVGDSAQVYRSRDEGDTWNELAPPNDNYDDIEDCISVEDGVLIVGANGLMAFTTDDGDSWQRIEHPWGNTHLWVLAEGDSNGEILLGGDKGLVASIQTNAAYDDLDDLD